MLIEKWGTTLAVRLPSSVVQALDLKEGDDIAIHVLDERTLIIVKKPILADLIEQLRTLRGTIPSDFKFDRVDANER